MSRCRSAADPRYLRAGPRSMERCLGLRDRT